MPLPRLGQGTRRPRRVVLDSIRSVLARLPLDQGFAALDLAAHVAPAGGRRAAFARDVLALPEGEVPAWCRRAWWGRYAGLLATARLQTNGFDADLEAHLVPFDTSAIEQARAQGRGVLMLGMHLGANRLVPPVLFRHFPETLFVFWKWPRGLGPMDVRVMNEADSQMAILAEARARLRAGGTVFMVPDASTKSAVRRPFGRGSIVVAQGPAVVARLSRAISIPIGGSWRGHRLTVHTGPAIDPAPAPAPEWEAAWHGAYLAWMEARMRSCPEDATIETMPLPPTVEPPRNPPRRRL